MNFKKLKKLIHDLGGKKIYVKRLAENDNSKNQVYLGSSFDVLNIFPIEEIYPDETGGWKRERFKASLNFNWISEDGELLKAPNSQLVLYPKYPEVRFSGFLANCSYPPDLMRHRMEDRLMIFSVIKTGEIVGFVDGPDSEISQELKNLTDLEKHGVFNILQIKEGDNKTLLLNAIKGIHQKAWINSKKLNKRGEIESCNAPQCGGYTLEAELGIIPNAYSEPDYLGWELKQFTVRNFEKYKSSVVTLMTPEPTGGIYKENGVKNFVKQYGYLDKNGKKDRLNFGGIHRVNEKHKNTNLTLEIKGFDEQRNMITDINGRIALVDDCGHEAASWSFESFLKHWKRKHSQACYIPTLAEENPRRYYFGQNVILGVETDFILFLKALSNGSIYYDPGIKLYYESGKQRVKARSQFRIKSGVLCDLYKNCEVYQEL